MNYFENLNSLNVNEKAEKKNGLTYLSWAWAVSEVTKKYPDMTYEIERFDNKPYLYDEKLGYMVFTKVTLEGITKEMWLPVMDGANKAMLDHPYEYQTKYGTKTCEAATMFDINKTIMRCLTKNLSMFGLGLYIYAGEDLPESEVEEAKAETEKSKKLPINKANADALILAAKNKGVDEAKILARFGKTSILELTQEEWTSAMRSIDKTPCKQESQTK